MPHEVTVLASEAVTTWISQTEQEAHLLPHLLLCAVRQNILAGPDVRVYMGALHQQALMLVSCRVALCSHLCAGTLTVEIKVKLREVLMLEHGTAIKIGKSCKSG